MTKQRLSIPGKFFLSLLLLAFVFSASAIQAKDVHLELQLIWGTNDPQSPNPKHKPLESGLAKKMKNTPFKWKNYFEVNRQEISVPPNAAQKAKMSPDCAVEVKNLADGRIEVTLVGKGKPVRTDKHPLANGIFVIGGDATNDTSWFVVVKEVK